MKVFLRDQQHRLAEFLPALRSTALSYRDASRFREQRLTLAVPVSQPLPPLTTCNLDFLFDYAVFPSRILVFAAEWQVAGRPMQTGDVIVQQVYLPPFPLSAKCVFGVRIVDVFRGPDRAGFSYGTLTGHAEQGESAFYFERSGDELFAVIHTHSRPGQWASRLAAPFFTYPYQKYCTQQALKRMRAEFLAANRSPGA